MRLKKNLLRTLFVGGLLFLFGIGFTGIINFSSSSEGTFWVKSYKINLVQDANASDDDVDDDNEYYEKVKENYYKNKINSSENLTGELTNLSDNKIDNNTQIKDQILQILNLIIFMKN